MTALRANAPARLASPGPRSRWRAARSLLRRSTAARATLLGLVGAIVGWVGVGIPSYWGDEAASVMSAERSLPGLFALARHVDAVHTAYYAFLHVWIRIAGTSELATRTPSAVAVGLLVAAVLVLGERLGGIRLGVAAGIVAIVLPRDSYLATEARSYAFAAAAAAWIGVLAVHLLQRRARPRPAHWVLLGVAIGAAAWMFLYSVLLIVVLLAAVLMLRRDLLRSWLLAAIAAGLVTAPIAFAAFSERHQIAFLAHRSVVSVDGVLVAQWFTKPWPAVLGWALVVAGIVLSARRRRGGTALVLGIAWVVIPTTLLLLADLVTPVYTTRYPSFCAPAVALLIGVGVVRIAESVRGRSRRMIAGGVALAAFAAVAAPVYVAQRGPYGQSGGADFSEAAAVVATVARPGDAVIFDEDTRPSLDPRLAYRLFPQDFAGLRDVELVTAFDRRARLWDTVRPLADVMPQLGDRVIAVERTAHGELPPDIDRLRGAGYRVESARTLNVETVYVLARAGSGAGSAVR